MGVIVQRYDWSEIVVKGTDGSGWSSDGVVMCLRRGKIEMQLSSGEIDQG
jgi:hypothetical protein